MASSLSTLLILSTSLLCGCAGTETAPNAEQTSAPAPVKLSTAHNENFDTIYRSSGTVRGRTTAVLTSKTTGYVRSVVVAPGDRVNAGQLLALLEANDSSASVRRARAGFEQSVEARGETQNSLLAAQAALRIAKSTQARTSALYASRSISQQEFDEADARLQGAQAEAEMAAARLRAASSRIDQAKAEVGEAQATLDYARIVAPFTGQVIERRIDPGNLASPGMPLLVLEQEGRLRVETTVEESHAASVTLGDCALVEIDSVAQPIAGTVGEIVPTVDVASRAFIVKVDLPAGLTALRPGMFARVGFRIGSRPRLVVPTTAVSPNGALDRVFAVDGERLRLRMVTLGEQQGPWTEVLSGLSPGERVVSQAGAQVSDGARFTEQP
ncbi:MAG: efflux RND transporter periplasmic adaptor subunit [Polyangiaceae bacterium]